MVYIKTGHIFMVYNQFSLLLLDTLHYTELLYIMRMISFVQIIRIPNLAICIMICAPVHLRLADLHLLGILI